MVETGKDYLFIDADGDIAADRIAPAPSSDVGSELRAAREARDLDLAKVAQDLRIRESFLKSLEAGSYDSLPAVAYAAGFVRSYAEYLGLDAAELVRRFKAEVSAAAGTQPLAFPQPVRYGGLPGVGLIAGSVLVAALLFGGWYLYGQGGDDGSSASAGGDPKTVAGAPAKTGEKGAG